MKRSPFRLESSLLPLAFLLITILGKPETGISVFTCYILLLILSLNAPGAYRNAAATEPGIRRVDARFLGSLIQSAIGIIILFILKALNILPFDIPTDICIAAGSLLLERSFEERLYAIGRRTDAFLLVLITFILFSAGTLVGSTWIGITLSVLIALFVTLENKPVKMRKPIFCYTYSPRSMLRDTLCPIVLLFIMRYLTLSPTYVYIGWVINSASATFARCSPDETRKPLFLISLIVFIATIITIVIPGLSPTPAICIAAILSLLTGATLDFRSIADIVLFIVVFTLSLLGQNMISIAASTAALMFAFDKRMLLRKV